MELTTASALQKKFAAGLQIFGEEDGELQWIGKDKQWNDLNKLDLFEAIGITLSSDRESELMEEQMFKKHSFPTEPSVEYGIEDMPDYGEK